MTTLPGSPVHTVDWIDAQQMQAQNPTTFSAPTTQELSTIEAGTHVKISNGDERFWVRVTSAAHGVPFVGTVANDLLGDYPYADYGSLVQFEKRHVHSML